MTVTLFDSINSSIFRFCSDFAEELRTAGTADLTLYNFDAFAVTNTLPVGDLIGPHQLTLDVDFRTVVVKGMIGVSSQSTDTNLSRLTKVAGLLLEKCLPDMVIPLYAADDSGQGGLLKFMEGTSLSPSMRALERPLRLLSFRVASDCAFSR